MTAGYSGGTDPPSRFWALPIRMNPAYIAIVIFILGTITQFIGYAFLAAKAKGREEEALRNLRNQIDSIGDLEDRVLNLEQEVANVRGYLRGSRGAPINGGN